MPRLDGHDLKALRLDTDWCCSDNDCNGFWFNAHHPEEHWVDAWRKVAKMSLPYKAVLGAGLKNEIRAMISGKSWGSGAFCSAGFFDRGLSVFPEFFFLINITSTYFHNVCIFYIWGSWLFGAAGSKGRSRSKWSCEFSRNQSPLADGLFI